VYIFGSTAAAAATGTVAAVRFRELLLGLLLLLAPLPPLLLLSGKGLFVSGPLKEGLIIDVAFAGAIAASKAALSSSV
jgi:hypothetical protein